MTFEILIEELTVYSKKLLLFEKNILFKSQYVETIANVIQYLHKVSDLFGLEILICRVDNSRINQSRTNGPINAHLTIAQV